MLWVPENVVQVFVPNFVAMPMLKPHLYDEATGSVPFRTCWLVFGRPGLNIAEGLGHALAPYKDQFNISGFRVPFDHGAHEQLTKRVDEIFAYQQDTQAPAGHVVVLDRGHMLCVSKNPDVVQWTASLPERIRGLRVIILLCCHMPTRQIPEDIRVNFQYQGKFHYTPPTPEWIKAYYQHAFLGPFKQFMETDEDAQRYFQPISFELADDDLSFLTECSDYATTSELYEFTNMVKASLQRPRGTPPGTVADAPIVFDFRYCKQLLRNVGGCLRVSEVVGYDAMQPFWECSGQGFPDPPERNERTIVDKQQFARENRQFTMVEEKTQTLTTREEVQAEAVAVKDGLRNVPITDPYIEEEEEEEPLKKRKIE
jgi:hypothetical protein